ncbi:MAG: LuxR family transcriptional regulator [Methylococcaceae bacterium]|nr:MAG: LuxR family transcriptional regulator [Methylococcaceae bacterium]
MALDNRIEFIHGLWDELADFDAARSDEALLHLMGGLCKLARAGNAAWVGAVRMDTLSPNDMAQGWRPRIVRHLHPSPPLDAATREQMDRLEHGAVDETIIRNLACAGTFRANRLRDLVGPEWFATPYYRIYYQGVGREDAVWVAFPVNQDAESWFGVFRGPDQPPFSAAERDELAYVLRGLKWFHRQAMLSHGLLVANGPLTPAERRVLRLLLTGLTEKEIADQLGRSHHTIHQWVTSIYRKFGVNNRAALMALWLGQAV